MFKLTRAFVIAAAVSSSILCAPVPQDVGKPISTGQSADLSAPASSVFGLTSKDPSYQSRPTGLCVVPALAKDAGLSQGQEQLTVQQAIELCPEAFTIAVSSKSSKRSMKDSNVAPQAPSPAPEPHSDAPHPARAVDKHPPNAEAPSKPTNEPLPGAPQPPVARDLPPQHTPVPQPAPEPLTDAFQPHVARDLPPQPEFAPSPSPQPHNPHPVRSRGEQPPRVGVPPQPDAPRPVAVRSKGEHHHDLQSVPVCSPVLSST
ncbi:unnamed protein product [Rhizoctonia solani]|uniref:Uncharacterized protein n=1 Tax=Rhizoctonia solani TaxID=456999 RepID=A0A8H3H098_9AGAM|nr:unnamed protein product [Rhizoctonia solani]